ncbi:endolytic transglycosylase MltG [Eubacterium sp. MSJ-33]|uniref:endolytic transglycosylase MltG n=1 Tax=Eubacterium sp. MSJ-33 TaxID=2841528 RepID=UPI001C77A9F3|nr:endolytic transglycosylase MltG [Eubacterium sp. MSJ-33]QWT52029.1 endolytic transglycosylase MltG [Eubacterium sp. MSJ-33]
MGKTAVRIVKGIILVVAILALANLTYKHLRTYYDDYMYEYKGTESREGVDVTVEIPEGASVKKIAEILKENGLINYPRAFTKRLQDSEYRGKLHGGTYTLNTGMTTLEMMAAMSPSYEENAPIDYLVVPEGFTVEMIAARCEEQGICSATEFLNACKSVTRSDFPYLEDIPAGANVKYKVQGFLFPATYDIYESTTAESLVAWMLQTFENYYTQDLQDRAAELGYSAFEVVTRASIVEREAKVDEERPIIAGVINNRLKADMPLQMCPTVLYPLTNGMYDKSQVLYEDLELDSPYNTYKNAGLPVGPICNPGIACINAVLYPQEHNYLYYHVGDEEAGTHIFTEDYEEHIDTQIIGGPNGVTTEGDESSEESETEESQ